MPMYGPVVNPLAKSPWNRPATVAGFAQSPPNATLISFVEGERRRKPVLQVLDLGCGAGRNAVPLAELGLHVVGLDLSSPMLMGAKSRAASAQGLDLTRARMDALPLRSETFDLVIAHGIWNLAASGDEFRRALREAARACRRGAGLFVFTFSRNTLPEEAAPVTGESFVFTQFSGQPQCFLTAAELVSELATAGFLPDPAVPLREHNRPRPGQLASGGPVIWEGAFRRKA